MSEPPADLPSRDTPGDNLPVLGVTEISQLVKRTIEGRFERVRVRGEISGFKRAASGHLYMALKDESAVLDGVCWRGTAGRLGLKPEDGMEVVATGRLTTYPGRSKYQMVIEALELAGAGALLKLLEERRKKLAAEGLFDAERKKPIPFLPEVIGVVTSPTGAVIRDILHRLADRFPRHVLVWPVLVQGDGAAAQVAKAIEGFNALTCDGSVPRPDLLIVARGGGSLEDLWAFNEEVVVRAAAASEIPLISAVGHETDTTLIDHVSDRRAPTPTAAAEMAVPVRSDLLAETTALGGRLLTGLTRMVGEKATRVEGLGRGLPDPERLLAIKTQSLDERSERLGLAAASAIERRGARVAELTARLPHPRQQLGHARQRFDDLGDRLRSAGQRLRQPSLRAFERVDAGRRLALALARQLGDRERTVGELDRLLETTNYRKVLRRGYAVVRGPKGPVTRNAEIGGGDALDLEFADGHRSVLARGEGTDTVKRKPQSKAKKAGKDWTGDPQGTLL